MYFATIFVCGPTGRLEFVIEAAPPASVPMPMIPSSVELNSTAPVGVPTGAVTVALNVTGCPQTDEPAGESVTTEVVVAVRFVTSNATLRSGNTSGPVAGVMPGAVARKT